MKRFGLALSLVALGATACASSGDVAPVEATGTTSAALGTLTSVSSFGSNPGALTMYKYVPQGVPSNAPLVVALHGCVQGAADFAKSGLNELADILKFYVLYPEQTLSNNPARCFNWAGEYGDATNLQRGKGENQSIKEMIDKMKADHSIDPGRVFLVGFSAGGAEAALMLATWPDLFAAAGIAAGVPYNCTTVYAEVSSCMKPGKDKTPQQWGDLARAGDPNFTGPWPRVSLWQGTADSIVGTANLGELVEQWTNVHGLTTTPSATSTVDGQQRQEFKNASGVTLVERWDIQGMDHGMPIDPANGCGTAGQYLLDKKICAARHMLEFFGIAATGPDGGVVPADGGGPKPDAGSSGGPKPSGTGSSDNGSGGSGNGNNPGPAPAGKAPGGSEGSSSVCTCRAAGAAPSPLGFLAAAAFVGLAALRRRSRGDA
jgi:poly(hydroxyalkanoate) depolymerase family esterase